MSTNSMGETESSQLVMIFHNDGEYLQFSVELTSGERCKFTISVTATFRDLQRMIQAEDEAVNVKFISKDGERLSYTTEIRSLFGRASKSECYISINGNSYEMKLPAKGKADSDNRQADRSDSDGVGDFEASKKRKSPPLIAEVYKRPKRTVVNLGLPINFHSEGDRHVRRLFYVAMANSKPVSDAYDDVVSNMEKFFQTYCLSNFSDMLISFAKEKNVVEMPAELKNVTEIPAPLVENLDRCIHKPIEISNTILIKHEKNAACSILEQIGYQYVVSHKMVDKTTDTGGSDQSFTSDSSDTTSKEEKKEFRKLLKVCQKKIEQPCDGMLDPHMDNHRKLKYCKTSPQTEFKILILLPENRKIICQEIATHIGLVFIDHVFEECKDEVLNKDLKEYTKKSESEVYSLMQNYVCRNLVLGRNNIILTCDENIYKNANAEVKLMLFEELDAAKRIMLKPLSHTFVTLPKKSSFFHYLQAVSYALNECMEFTTSINVIYQVKKNNSNEVEYCRCQVPATGIIPYYILKFFCAKRMAESKSEKQSLFS